MVWVVGSFTVGKWGLEFEKLLQALAVMLFVLLFHLFGKKECRSVVGYKESSKGSWMEKKLVGIIV